MRLIGGCAPRCQGGVACGAASHPLPDAHRRRTRPLEPGGVARGAASRPLPTDYIVRTVHPRDVKRPLTRRRRPSTPPCGVHSRTRPLPPIHTLSRRHPRRGLYATLISRAPPRHRRAATRASTVDISSRDINGARTAGRIPESRTRPCAMGRSEERAGRQRRSAQNDGAAHNDQRPQRHAARCEKVTARRARLPTDVDTGAYEREEMSGDSPVHSP
ncbi:hypothetical protein HYPSUDRAFT_641629 [Hypholoma sublateritium FD-334 SS-4]|uniref:Uncharacterized protein n=1 Tax=Hypholoma sublateritium (strain FD-334 SS-4) TaxID=945553 RepID=A0A0D2N124_HYPSF|nr:hypothetical protein HYPSUDRAFT_660134 [Hypholoma sublateritium FD-334 SS-4]KJA22855.1 hypothetical protein HYPSUDRAFT_641629 [Hypholoma sublateritium FD-334 SS-4]